MKGAILAAIGSRVLALALWFYRRADRTPRVSIADDRMVLLSLRPRTGNAELDRMLDKIDDNAEAFFRENPGASTMLNAELNSPGSARYVSEEEWPAFRQKIRNNVAALARPRGEFM